MSRYIDADKIKYYCKQSHECLSNAECEYCDHYKVCKIDIDSIPTADVKPIIRGKWIETCKGLIVTDYKCSICGRTVRDDTGYDVTVDYPYCNCGAKMKKESEEEE